MVAVHDLKRGHVVGRMHTAVEDKFGSGEEGDPIVLVGISEELEVVSDFLVRAFHLPV